MTLKQNYFGKSSKILKNLKLKIYFKFFFQFWIFYNTIYRNIKFNLTNLSSKFKKIKLAFIVKKDAGTFAYTTPILSIIDNKV